MVPGVGLEPTHPLRYRILNPARLPISPPRQQSDANKSDAIISQRLIKRHSTRDTSPQNF